MAEHIIRKQILFYVQHLLGIGHFHRAARLTRQLQDAGLAVTLVSGGMPCAHEGLRGASFAQLDPVRAADTAFSQLLDVNGAPIDDAWRNRRKAMLLKIFQDCTPDAVLIEMFPFGRRQFAFELIPMLAAARARKPAPVILSSVRDILIPSQKPGRSEEAIARARIWFDHILVHGDPEFVRLEESYPPAAQLSAQLIYTGYVTDEVSQDTPGTAGENEILVSAGGGAAGDALMQAALRARALSRCAGTLVWRLLIGANAPQAQLRGLQAAAPEGIVVECARPDFPAMLHRCAASVSQAGYNTVMDILRARPPAVLVPFTTPAEKEQTLRAAILARAQIAVHLSAEILSPAALAAAVDQALLQRTRPARLPDMDGGAATARFLRERLNA